ncbi:hypothetical protein L195_g057412, partial [Trifolium pratense]
MNYVNTDNFSVSVETPGETITSSSTVVAPAMEKLDQILCQNLITGDKVIKMVEQVKDGLKDLQNIVSNLSSGSERESVWLEEKRMKYVRTQIGDALHRSFTYEVRGNDTGVGLGFKQRRSKPVPDIPLEMLIM